MSEILAFIFPILIVGLVAGILFFTAIPDEWLLRALYKNTDETSKPFKEPSRRNQ